MPGNSASRITCESIRRSCCDYDIYVLTQQATIDYKVLHDAFMATSLKRNTMDMLPRFDTILDEIRSDAAMATMWNKYRRDIFFVGELTWAEVNKSVKRLKATVLG